MNLLQQIPDSSVPIAPCKVCGGTLWHSYTSIGIPLICSICTPFDKRRVKFRKTLIVDDYGETRLVDFAYALKIAEEDRLGPATASDLDPDCPIFANGTDDEFNAWLRRIAKTSLPERRRLRAEAIAARGGDPEPEYVELEKSAIETTNSGPPAAGASGQKMIANLDDLVNSYKPPERAPDLVYIAPVEEKKLPVVAVPDGVPKTSKKKAKREKFNKGQGSFIEGSDEYI